MSSGNHPIIKPGFGPDGLSIPTPLATGLLDSNTHKTLSEVSLRATLPHSRKQSIFIPESATLIRRLNNERIRYPRVDPQLDGGRYPVKRVLGETLKVSATILHHGSDVLNAVVRFKHIHDTVYHESPMKPLGNDQWETSFLLDKLGLFSFTIESWIDTFATWLEKIKQLALAGEENIQAEFVQGTALLRGMANRATHGEHRVRLLRLAAVIGDLTTPGHEAMEAILHPDIVTMTRLYPERVNSTLYEHILNVMVDPVHASYSSWYELFPRSQSTEPGKIGTFRDIIVRLPEIQQLGYDVLYFPPIHPIGMTNRKGKNNSKKAEAGDVGSPWAIGNWQGGHDAIDPALGTIQEFRMLVGSAEAHGIRIALDLTIQCSQDHPYLQTHPEWFHRKPQGLVELASTEHSDIVSFNFECQNWFELWMEWLRVVSFWIEQGVKIFRVDSPQNKPLGFWEWLISEVRKNHPEVIFLADALARPAMMKELAKVGFSQSTTYFIWRTSKTELQNYVNELNSPELTEFFRPNFFANTPDHLHEYLQAGGPNAFAVRLLLAATLSSSYGLYAGFELCENKAQAPGSEAYADSEKYELKQRIWNTQTLLNPLVRILNHARARHASLQQNRNIKFHSTSNERLLCYSKLSRDGEDQVLTVVNLNPFSIEAGIIELNLETMGLREGEPFEVHDLLSGQTVVWRDRQNFVQLDPQKQPGHLFVVRSKLTN